MALLNVGTPLWKKPTSLDAVGKPVNTLAALPSETTSEHSIFVGVTVRDVEDTSYELQVQRTGLMLVRAVGPVRVGDTLVQVPGKDYVAAGAADAPVAGVSESKLDAAPDDGKDPVSLIYMRSEGGGGGGTSGDAVWS